MRNGGEYDWLLSKIPGWKTYTSLKASLRAFLAYYKKAKGVLAETLVYLRSNKRYVAKYSVLYLIMWTVEWFLGVPVEFVILGGGLCCLFIDLYINLLRPVRPSSTINTLKRGASLKKKAFKRQKLFFVVWSHFYVGVGRFLSNPSLRVAKTKASNLFNYMWLAAFVGTFLDFILCPPLMAWLGHVPPTYPDHARSMGLMVSGFFIDNGLDYTQSHLVNWLLGLATFVALISQTALIEGRALYPFIRAALKKLLVTFLAILLLETMRISALDFVLINQLNAHPIHATTAYVFLPFIWWALYLRTFEYLSKKGGRSSAAVFNSLIGLTPDRSFQREITPLRSFLNRAPLAVSFGVLCFFYLSAKILITLTLGLD